MNKNSLTEAQKFLLNEIFLNDDFELQNLISKLFNGELTGRERLLICKAINNKIIEKGLDNNDEPTNFGIELENLLDIINRPNIV